jgi:hypothetical protein
VAEALAALALSLTASAVLAVTIVSMVRAAGRAKRTGERIWLAPRHTAGLAVCTALLSASTALDGHWVFACAAAALSIADAVLGVRTAQLGRRLRRIREGRAEAERRYAEARAEWERFANGGDRA